MAVEFEGDYKRTTEYRIFPEDIKIKADLNGRFEKPDIEYLITDIIAHGQHTPVIIRKDGGEAVLIAGFSRWRAVSEINKRKLAPVKMALRCTYMSCNEADGFLLNISENRFRNPPTALDDAHNIKRLLNVYAMTEDDIVTLYFPTAKTESEIKSARKFLKERITLISLSSEAKEAVKSGRVKGNAAAAIAKLSEEHQREIVKKSGTIERKDVSPAKPPKPKAKDVELLRRIALIFDEIEGLLLEKDMDFIEVDRILLLNLRDYVKETYHVKSAE